MKNFSKLSKLVVVAALIGGAVVLGQKLNSGGGKPEKVDVRVPVLSAMAEEGKGLFDKNCATCHGKNIEGTDQGPTLVNAIYRTNHHADQAFVLAALRGVRAHHWKFGDMPKQPQVTQAQVLKITRYVRELQAANGIN